MKLLNDGALQEFRGPGECSWCRMKVRNREPHHIYSRGAGQVDHPWNIAALCAVFSGGKNCHHEVHQGNVDRSDLELMVAGREGIMQGHISHLVWAIRRLPKGTDPEAAVQAIYDELGYTGPRRCTTAEIVVAWPYYPKERRA